MPRSGAADLSCGAGPAGLVAWSADVIEQALSLDDIAPNSTASRPHRNGQSKI
jgi:hypothetical protein